MTMRSLTERSDLRLKEDVYAAQARPGRPELLVNLGYRQIAIVDCRSGSLARAIALPAELGDFAIESWLVTPDGAASYLFGRYHDDVVVRVEHDSGATKLLARPGSLSLPLGLAWPGDELCFLDAKRSGYSVSAQGFGSVEARDVRAATKEMRKRLPNLDEMSVYRMADGGRAAYLLSSEKIGYATLDGRTALFTPHDDTQVNVARLGDSLFVCFEYSIEQRLEGEEETLAKPGSGEHFLGVESVTDGDRGHLVVLSGSLASDYSRLRFFGD